MSNVGQSTEEESHTLVGRELLGRCAICLKMASLYKLDNAAMKPPTQALVQLLERGLAQDIVQLALADQDELNQFLRLRLEIR